MSIAFRRQVGLWHSYFLDLDTFRDLDEGKLGNAEDHRLVCFRHARQSLKNHMEFAVSNWPVFSIFAVAGGACLRRCNPSNSIGRLQRQNACTNRRQFGAIRAEPGNPRLRRTAWWGTQLAVRTPRARIQAGSVTKTRHSLHS